MGRNKQARQSAAVSAVLMLLLFLLPLAVGGLAAFLTKEGMMMFNAMPKPPLTPPGWSLPKSPSRRSE